MKKLLALLAVALLASGAMAQVDPDPDGMGIYFDAAGTITEMNTVAPFEQITAYLIITRPSSTFGVSGWEAWVTGADALTAASWTLAAGLDVDSRPEGFQVGIGTDGLALPYGSAIVLATLSGFVQTTTTPVALFVEGVPGSTSFDGTPGYAAGNDAGDLRACQVSSGTGSGMPVACINDACTVVANEDMTFSHVKALFR